MDGPGRGPMRWALAMSLFCVVAVGWAPSAEAAVNFGPPTEFPAGSSPVGMVLADVNGDHHLDAIVGKQFGGGSVLLGNGDGTFAAPISLSGPGSSTAVAVGDFNGDGNPDVAIADGTDSTVTVMLGDGHGGFAAAPGGPFTTNVGGRTDPIALASGDVNGDHRDDLFVVDKQAGPVGHGGLVEMRGSATGALGAPIAIGDATTTPGVGVIAADLGNGHIDVAWSHDSTVSAFSNDGAGNLTAHGGPSSSGAGLMLAGKFTSSGNVDLVNVGAAAHQIDLFPGQGAGGGFGFNLPTGAAGDLFSAATVAQSNNDISDHVTGLAAGDLDGNGTADLVTADSITGGISVYANNGSATPAQQFLPPVKIGGGFFPTGVGVGDLNGDGRPDVVVADGAASGVQSFSPGRRSRPSPSRARAPAAAPEGSSTRSRTRQRWPRRRSSTSRRAARTR